MQFNSIPSIHHLDFFYTLQGRNSLWRRDLGYDSIRQYLLLIQFNSIDRIELNWIELNRTVLVFKSKNSNQISQNRTVLVPKLTKFLIGLVKLELLLSSSMSIALL